jgi:hypothetical protein
MAQFMEEDNAATETRRAAKEAEQGNDMSCVICYMPFEEDYDIFFIRNVLQTMLKLPLAT